MEDDAMKDLKAELKSYSREVRNDLQLDWAEDGQKDSSGTKGTLESPQNRIPDYYKITYLLGLTQNNMGEDDKAAELF
jgi:hypothetical protein